MANIQTLFDIATGGEDDRKLIIRELLDIFASVPTAELERQLVSYKGDFTNKFIPVAMKNIRINREFLEVYDYDDDDDDDEEDDDEDFLTFLRRVFGPDTHQITQETIKYVQPNVKYVGVWGQPGKDDVEQFIATLAFRPADGDGPNWEYEEGLWLVRDVNDKWEDEYSMGTVGDYEFGTGSGNDPIYIFAKLNI